jgi:DNA-directed RNA polymerase III subunit RPC1
MIRVCITMVYYHKYENVCFLSDVVIRNSELLAGALDKSLLGSGGKGNVFYVLLRDWGENVSIKAMARLSRLASNFLMNRGFSIGIEDVMPDVNLVNTKKQLVTEKSLFQAIILSIYSFYFQV